MKLEWLAIFSTAFQFAILITGTSNNNPIGISNHFIIQDNQLTSSSPINSTFPPESGRLGGSDAWCANSSDMDPFLEIDLGIVYDICAVAVQGRAGDNVVTNFRLLSSSDGINFVIYGIFNGMSPDGDIVENHTLVSTLTTRYIRFSPISNDMCLRVEVYGLASTCGSTPVGVAEEIKVIKDEQMSSSSSNGSNFEASSGRLNGPHAWCPNASSDTGPYLEIDLEIAYDICAIKVQGMSGDSTIRSFMLSFSLDGMPTFYGGMLTFTGTSSDGNTPEFFALPNPETARYIRFHPRPNMCLRVEVYGVPNGVQVRCDRSQIVATINRTIHGDDLTLRKESCGQRLQENDTTILTATLGTCGTLLTISKDISMAFYRNEVRQNSTNATFHIICSYERSPFQISGDGILEFSMKVFQDGIFTSPLLNYIVPLGQTLYFQIEVDATGSDLNLHVDRCWATPTDNSSHEDSYDLINNGCQSGRFINYSCDSSSNIQRFALRVFRFAGQLGPTSVYVHCLVTACLESNANSVCKTNCCTTDTPRRRRSLEERIEGDFEMQSLLLGPFIIVDRNDNNVDEYDDDDDDDDDIKEKGPPVDHKESDSLSGHVVVIVAVSGSIAIALIVSLLVFLFVLKGVRGRTVKDVTSDLAVDNLAFDKVDVKTLSIKSN